MQKFFTNPSLLFIEGVIQFLLRDIAFPDKQSAQFETTPPFPAQQHPGAYKDQMIEAEGAKQESGQEHQETGPVA